MDIVERLRKHVNDRGGASLENGAWSMMLKGANEIERLQKQAHYHYENGLKKDVEIERLQDALQTIAEEGSGWGQSVALAALKGSELWTKKNKAIGITL